MQPVTIKHKTKPPAIIEREQRRLLRLSQSKRKPDKIWWHGWIPQRTVGVQWLSSANHDQLTKQAYDESEDWQAAVCFQKKLYGQ